MDMEIDIFADLSFGKIALSKMTPVPPNFRLYYARWLDEKPEDRKIMQVKGAEYRAAKSGQNKGKLSIRVPGTTRSVYVTADEMRALDSKQGK